MRYHRDKITLDQKFGEKAMEFSMRYQQERSPRLLPTRQPIPQQALECVSSLQWEICAVGGVIRLKWHGISCYQCSNGWRKQGVVGTKLGRFRLDYWLGGAGASRFYKDPAFLLPPAFPSTDQLNHLPSPPPHSQQ